MWISRREHEILLTTSASRAALLKQHEEFALQLLKRQEELEREVERERKRADNAIDELLAVRGIPPVSVPSPQPDPEVRSPFTEDTDERARILKQYESLGPEVLVQEATQ